MATSTLMTTKNAATSLIRTMTAQASLFTWERAGLALLRNTCRRTQDCGTTVRRRCWSGLPFERGNGAAASRSTLIPGSSERSRHDLRVVAVVDSNRVVRLGGRAAIPIVHANRVSPSRRPADRPRDVLVSNVVDSASGIRVEVERATARRAAVRVKDLLAAGVHHVKVDIAVGIPRERHLHVASTHGDDRRRQSHVRPDDAARIRNGKQQFELAEWNRLRERSEERR